MPYATTRLGQPTEAISTVTFFNQVYAWMCLGLALTGGIAAYAANTLSPSFYSGTNFLILMIVELVLVIFLSAAAPSMPSALASLIFLVYAALNGLTMSVIFKIYAQSTIGTAFLISAGTFAIAALYGAVTKRNLDTLGRVFGLLLWGLIFAMIVSFFVANTWLEYGINCGGVVLFIGLTAYDNQKLKEMAKDGPRMAIVGSLILYLDFINLFLFIVKLLGGNGSRSK